MSDDLGTQAIVRLGNTDAAKAKVVGSSVYDPLIFSRQVVKFSRRQYLFLNSYRLGMSLGDAAAKAGLSEQAAERFLCRPKTKEWLADRAKKDYIRQEWHESAKWWEVGQECLDGKRHLSKDQQVVFLEFGKRVCPESKTGEGNRATIQINIDPTAVQEAFRRQNAIEAELSQPKEAA